MPPVLGPARKSARKKPIARRRTTAASVRAPPARFSTHVHDPPDFCYPAPGLHLHRPGPRAPTRSVRTSRSLQPSFGGAMQSPLRSGRGHFGAASFVRSRRVHTPPATLEGRRGWSRRVPIGAGPSLASPRSIRGFECSSLSVLAPVLSTQPSAMGILPVNTHPTRLSAFFFCQHALEPGGTTPARSRCRTQVRRRPRRSRPSLTPPPEVRACLTSTPGRPTRRARQRKHTLPATKVTPVTPISL